MTCFSLHRPFAALHSVRALALCLLTALALVSVEAAFAQEPRAAASPVTGRHMLKRETWTGDLPGMIERRRVRVLVPYNKTMFFLDRNGTARGVMADLMHAFEAELNRQFKSGKRRINVEFVPTSRDRLIPDLIAGRGDLIAANLTITPERTAQVAFSTPLARDVREVVVRAADAPPIASLDDLSGKEVIVGPSTSYRETLRALNEEFTARGLAPMLIVETPGHFETEDVLEMLNAGLASYTVADDYFARFWGQIFPDIRVHEDLPLTPPGEIALVFRKDSPELQRVVDAFAAPRRKGTAFGNQKLKEYLRSVKWALRASDPGEMAKVARLAGHFQRYGTEHHLDWVLMMAMGYQESRLDQSVKSRVGAIGIMQLMPATGRELKVGDIRKERPNIHGGVKYVHRLYNAYYRNEPMTELDKELFSIAAYNAGPGRIRGLRAEAAKLGLDPNVWFDNVEQVAERRIGAETVQYVANISKYYYAYNRLRDRLTAASP